MLLVMNERLLSGQYSFISVTALGMAAPRPRPVMKRKISSSVRLVAVAEISDAPPITTTEPISSHLRPKRPASGPAPTAPKARPNSAAITAACDDSMPASLNSTGIQLTRP